jgi:hypothetical protein
MLDLKQTTLDGLHTPAAADHFLLLRRLLRVLLLRDCGIGSSVASCSSDPPSDWMVR